MFGKTSLARFYLFKRNSNNNHVYCFVVIPVACAYFTVFFDLHDFVANNNSLSVHLVTAL